MTIPTMPGGALVQDTRLASSWTIDGVEMLCPAWFADVKVLLSSPQPRGKDVLIPGVPGETAYPRRPTVTVRTVNVPIVGFVTRAGVANSDPWAGFVTNVLYLRTNVCDPVATGNGTRASVLTLAGGTSRSGPITPLGLELGDMVGPVCLAQFTYSIPLGSLA